ncbi:GNAT family N-acetyltransferase, partial [Candidatus Dojkabacteria bacterium]|nr:GNAT family N-acetyltransferase [Candidatus Dojkabacteria bacterium]
YCRLTRVVRDIPSTEIVAGNKYTNFRQIAEREIEKQGKTIQDIRNREIRAESVNEKDLELEVIKYDTTVSEEYFLSFKTKKHDKICSFLRLSLPTTDGYIDELKECSIIREVHVYGTVVNLGKGSEGEAQHLGLGTKMIKIAEEISKKNGFRQIAVISAIGTRRYYEKRGYKNLSLYMTKKL